MQLDPNFVTELRVMFLNGATPGHLVQHIASRYADDSRWSFSVEEYFSEAFQLGMLLPRVIDPVDLNLSLLRDMVGRTKFWRDAVAHLVPVGAAWCDGLDVAIDDYPMLQAIRPESHPALADLWPTLSPKAQSAIRQPMVNAQAYYERAQVLARLVARLQQRVAELESQEAVVTTH